MDIDTTANYKMSGVQHHDSVRLDTYRGIYVLGRLSFHRVMFVTKKTPPGGVKRT